MHPFVKIFGFIMLLISMSYLTQFYLIALCVFSCAVALGVSGKNFSRVMLRMRWLFLSILIVYALTTPGEYVQPFPFDTAPTYEGLESGLLQVAKLLIALASLSVLFATSSQAQLMLGLYYLLLPLRWLGLNVERFTARLLLTLDYVEVLALDKHFKINFQQFDNLHKMTNSVTQELLVPKQIELDLTPFNKRDKLAMCIFAGCMLGLVLFGLKVIV